MKCCSYNIFDKNIFFQIRMTEYVSILSCISVEEGQGGEVTEDELSEEERKEVQETVDDLISIQNPDIMKRNLTHLVTENIKTKKKLKVLESDLERRGTNFLIDCDGEEETEQTQPEEMILSDSVGVLGGKVDCPPSPSSTPSKFGSCFNCEGSHLLSECSEPRDEEKISRRKTEMRNSKPASTPRYHLEERQRFGGLKPGLPSPRLREALGLRSEELPRYIYMMRQLGYPPGWLSDARVSQSGLALYHNKVETGQEDGEVGEVGEVKDEGEEAKEQYDLDRLITWPGFNGEAKQFRDDSAWHRVRPDISWEHSPAEMGRRLGASRQRSYVRGEMQDLASNNTGDITRNSSGEMSPPGEEQDSPMEEVETVNTPVKERVTATDPGTLNNSRATHFSLFDNFRNPHSGVIFTISKYPRVFKVRR